MNDNENNNLYGMTRTAMEDYLLRSGENPAKAQILFRLLYRQRISGLQQINELRKPLVKKLETDFSLQLPQIIRKQENRQVCKYLFRMADDCCVEAVLMKHGYGDALCVSTQVGCNMGCRFCASGKLKKQRDLTAAEMTGQLLRAEADQRQRIAHLVIMGIGEPFDNYLSLCDFIDIITDPAGLDVGARHITVSTCGLVKGIERFSQRTRPNNLAVSLHAPTDELREQLMPINKAYPLPQLMESLRRYQQQTGQKITIEYLLLDGINDGLSQADELVGLLYGIDCTVNLIPYNATPGSCFRRSTAEQTLNFYDRLKKHGQHVTLRKELGSDIDAACGQLRAQEIGNM